ncbi:MAG: SDR family oxidoreductase [Candidatus Methylacidiphilales bacterium]|nr:SDR family oxidoreductase [Candidatus Methylacidiphilales bacterium]
MDLLFIGGTGNISAASVRLALAAGHRVTLLNRGRRPLADYGIHGAEIILADVNDESATRAALGDRRFDVVANFIAFKPADIERDIRLFSGQCGQYFFISSASAYEKPLRHPFVTESHPLKNPYWEYSRDKIACEDTCTAAYRNKDFPAVIVRPSLTYETVWPIAIGGWNDFTLIDRIRRGGEMIVHGDGTSLWTVTHSEDFARGFNGLFGNTAAVGHAFHITSDEVLTWNQLYTLIAEAAGVEPKLVHISSHFLAQINPAKRGSLLGDKAHSAIFSNAKIKQFVPGFQAVIPFHQGVRRTLAWFEADTSRQRIVPAINEGMDAYIAAWRKATATIEP